MKIPALKETKVSPSANPGATLETEIGTTPHVFERDYRLDKKLRSGSYGVVYTTFHKNSHEEFAVKVIDRTKLKEKDDLIILIVEKLKKK